MTETKQQKLAELEKYGTRARGQKDLRKFYKGEHITRGQAINAYCYDCMGYCRDGRVACMSATCPLSTFSPYTTHPPAAKEEDDQSA